MREVYKEAKKIGKVTYMTVKGTDLQGYPSNTEKAVNKRNQNYLRSN